MSRTFVANSRGERVAMERVDGGMVPVVHVGNDAPIPVTVVNGEGGGVTDTQLRASPLPVSIVGASVTLNVDELGDVDISDRAGRLLGHVIVDSMPAGSAALTDAELRADPVAVEVSNYPASQAVTGAFYQTTQPVSGPATDAQMRAAPIPISGTVTVNVGLTDTQLRATPLPVSGTFYQATQPVSGTFWQATQPVSAAALPLPSGASTEATLALIKAKTDNLDVALSTRAVTGLTDTQLRAVAVPVSGTFYQATQPISAASLPLPSGASTETTLAAASAKLPATLGQKAMVAALAVSLASDQSAIPVTPPTLTKGTQGATGLTTQDLKDAGRVLKTYTCTAIATVTSEALITLTPYADLVAGGGATTLGVTAGKRLRIQKITVTVRATSTVSVGGIVRFRLLAGAVLVGSPIHDSIGCMASNLATAVIGNAQSFVIPFPDGLELSGTMQFGLTQLFSATSATIDVHITAYEY